MIEMLQMNSSAKRVTLVFWVMNFVLGLAILQFALR